MKWLETDKTDEIDRTIIEAAQCDYDALPPHVRRAYARGRAQDATLNRDILSGRRSD